MKNKILLIILASITSCWYGCSDDEIIQPNITITELITNGTFIPNGRSQIQGTLFVTDQNGNSVNGLSNSNVTAKLSWTTGATTDTVSVGGAVTLIPYSQENRIVAGAVTMDYSGSMQAVQIACMKSGVLAYIDSMRNSDITEIIKFSSTVAVVQAFTSNKQLLINAVNANWPGSGGSTALYQSIYKATQDASAQPMNQYVRAVIAFTDGLENASSVSRTAMINYALQNAIPVYTVGLIFNQNSAASLDLKNIADTTGAFYFRSHPDTCSNLTDVYKTISGQLAGAYSLTVNWEGNLPNAGTVVTARITTTFANFTSSFSRSYIMP